MTSLAIKYVSLSDTGVNVPSEENADQKLLVRKLWHSQPQYPVEHISIPDRRTYERASQVADNLFHSNACLGLSKYNYIKFMAVF